MFSSCESLAFTMAVFALSMAFYAFWRIKFYINRLAKLETILAHELILNGQYKNKLVAQERMIRSLNIEEEESK